MTCEVTRVQPSELPTLSEMGGRFYSEGGLPGRFDRSVFSNTWSVLLQTQQAVIFRLTLDGRSVGAIGGLCYPDVNDGALVATEMFWFVEPEARGRGLLLLNAFEQWARDCGAKRINMVHLTALRSRALERLYERRGYRPVEIHYIKEVV